MSSDRFQLAGTSLDGKFRVEQFVAEGGFATVYSGRHLTLDRQVAIKVLKTPAHFNDRAREDFIAKFQLEARTIARLNHANIVQVIDFGVSTMPAGPTAPWMVLEWLTGRPLDRELESRRGQGGRPPAAALALLEPIFDALAYAHDEGIAHRDVKPGNIMIVPTKRGETLKLLDFGIVKVMEEGESADNSLTRTSSTLTSHTPAYAAPEQVTGLKTGPWTDVHALGLLLTESLTDLPPYDSKNIATLHRQILSPERPTPARRLIDAGPWEPILSKALALEPSERFRNAGEFLRALKAAVPTGAQPMQFATGTQTLPRADEKPDRTQIFPRKTGSPSAEPAERSEHQPSSQSSAGGRRKGAMTAGVILSAIAGATIVYWVLQRPKPVPPKPVATQEVLPVAPPKDSAAAVRDSQPPGPTMHDSLPTAASPPSTTTPTKGSLEAQAATGPTEAEKKDGGASNQAQRPPGIERKGSGNRRPPAARKPVSRRPDIDLD